MFFKDELGFKKKYLTEELNDGQAQNNNIVYRTGSIQQKICMKTL
jgi:hypothetical protein